MGNLEVLFLLLLPIIYPAKGCTVSKCGTSGFPIRFPFYLEGQQPLRCAYPGFYLGCNSRDKTVQVLPFSREIFVQAINYNAQTIQLYDPASCLPRQLLQGKLNLSGTSFVPALSQNFTFLSCPSNVTLSLFTVISCLSNSTYSVLATASEGMAKSMPSSCQILTTLPVPVSWPIQPKELSTDFKEILELTWKEPDCRDCESKGGVCGYKNNTSTEIGCFYRQKEIINRPLIIFWTICMIIAIPALCFALGFGYVAYVSTRDHSGGNRNQNSDPAAVAAGPTIVTGLEEETIQSYQKVVLGESKRLPGPNDGTCAICLSEYCFKDTLRCIPECKHCFHVDCIDEWLRMNSSCPVCRNSPSPVRGRQSENV